MFNSQSSEGADTLITTHLHQGQLPWQVDHKLLLHAAMMYQMLPQNKDATPGEIGQNLVQKQFYQMLPTDFTKQDAVKTAEVLGVGVKSLERWLLKFVQSNDLQRISHGLYRKSNPLTA